MAPDNPGVKDPSLMHAQLQNRREWMKAAAAAATVATCGRLLGADERRPKVAAVVTEFTYRSHAHVLLENFLEPYYFNGQLTDPGMDVVSLYVDQFPKGDMARDAARQYGFTIYPTIREALQRGGDELAVDGVLAIGEHGTYPRDNRGVTMYPRKRFFDEIVAVFRDSGRVVPVFNDKHLSYRSDWADEMIETAQELKIPFLAGSSVPLAERRPPLEMPPQAQIEEAVSIHSGPPESYDFHALEVLQSMVESRRGGETGVRAVQWLQGDAVWKAAESGAWDASLAEAALRTSEKDAVGPLHDFVEPEDGKRHPVHAVLIEYRDGLRATVLRLGHSSTRWKFACRINGKAEPLATSFFVGPWQNRNLFKALAHAVQTHICEKQAPYPVERTHLVTNVLAAAMDSRFQKQVRIETPRCEIAYLPRDYRALREMGQTWTLLTEDLPEPNGIDPGGPRPGR
jgi:hypothetical protein